MHSSAILLALPDASWLKPYFDSHADILEDPGPGKRPDSFDLPGRTVRVLIAGGRPLDTDLLDRLPSLQLIACAGAGHEVVDLPLARTRGIAVTRCEGANAADTAEHAVALLLAVLRDIPQGDAFVRAGLWKDGQRGPWRRSLTGMPVGIVGLGAIGLAAAERLAAFGADVHWWGPSPKPHLPYRRADGLMDLAGRCEALLLCAAAGHDSTPIIDAAVLGALGPKGVFVNIARGSLVDEAALAGALRNGGIAGAALDVFLQEPTDPSFWADCPNLIMSPHVGGFTPQAMRRVVEMLVQGVTDFLNDGTLRHRVA